MLKICVQKIDIIPLQNKKKKKIPSKKEKKKYIIVEGNSVIPH